MRGASRLTRIASSLFSTALLMKKIVIFIFAILLPLGLSAQKKDIVQIKEFLKKGTSLDKAQQMTEKLLADSVLQNDPHIWQLLGESLYQQYNAANEKLYLKQKYDTTQFFALTKRLFNVYETIDSLAMKDSKRYKAIVKSANRRAEELHLLRPNLYNGGIYQIHKQDYASAYDYFDNYIACAEQPLFKHYQYFQTDTLLPRAAYWAVYCGYKSQNPKQALHHAYMALKDTANAVSMLQFLAETYKLDNDSVRYIKTLEEGFQRDPTFPYFFPRLFQHYSQHEDWDKCWQLIHTAQRVDPVNPFFAFAKSNIYLNTGRYDDCITLCDSLIHANDTIARIHLNAGLAYYYKGVMLEKKLKKTNQEKREILDCYRQARPYLETYRARRPLRSDKWAMPLYIIYLNLNMGKEFDEIDNLLRFRQNSQSQ